MDPSKFHNEKENKKKIASKDKNLYMLDPSIFLDFTVYPHGWAPPKTSPWVATRFMHPHEWLLNCTLFHGRTHHACLHRVGPSVEERAGGFEKFSCNFLICAYYDLRILSVGNL